MRLEGRLFIRAVIFTKLDVNFTQMQIYCYKANRTTTALRYKFPCIYLNIRHGGIEKC